MWLNSNNPRSTFVPSSARPTVAALWRRGFTLVELLVVIAIIGVLVSLLLPAVQAAREAGRRSQCANHLKQLGLASLQHESAHRFYPSGGWGWPWSGLADRGVGKKQPGGWVYNLLPYIEQSSLHDVDRGLLGTGAHPGSATLQSAVRKRIETVISTMHCPSRRPGKLYPIASNFTTLMRHVAQSPTLTQVAKGDYAINGGEQAMTSSTSNDTNWGGWRGAPDLTTGDTGVSPTFSWTDLAAFTGIAMSRSEISIAEVRDGTSKTLLIAEKNVDPNHYETGNDLGDDQTVCGGFDQDSTRWAKDLFGVWCPPRQDVGGAPSLFSFGGPHSGVWMAVLCDGSVQSLNYDISNETYRRLLRRNDGEVLDVSGL